MKKYLWMSSAAVVIGVWRVKQSFRWLVWDNNTQVTFLMIRLPLSLIKTYFLCRLPNLLKNGDYFV